MVIDINNISSQPAGKPRSDIADGAATDVNQATTQATAPSSSAGAVVNDSSTNADTVQLSDQAQELNRIQQSLKSFPDVDNAKVEAIRAQIASGSYQVNAEQLADKIIADDANFYL